MENETRDRLQALLGDAYSIERELGGGGMSRLFLAVERSLGRRVVIKLLPPEWVSEVSAQRFQREIALTANLPHPHILPILAAGAREGHLYYVTPYLPGESLAQRLQAGRLPIGDALRLLSEIADALAFAHAQGVLHRDVKPANVLIQDGHAVLADFGVARALAVSQGAGAVTRTGVVVGTPGYMSPEQLAGDVELDARADVYALSVLAYEMLAGQPPFAGSSATQVMAAHLTQTPRALAELCPGVPVAVEAVIERGLSKLPAGRPTSASEFRSALETKPVSRSSLRSRPLAAGLAAVGLIALAIAYRMWQREPAAVIDSHKLLIAPIAVLDPRLAEWRIGIVDWLSRSLDGAGELRTVPVSAVVAHTRGSGAVDALALSRKLRAGIAVDGSLIRAAGDSVRLALTVRDSRTGDVVVEASVANAESSFDRLMDSASVQLLQGLGRSRAIRSLAYGSVGSRSLPAIKAFLRGEEEFRRLDLVGARRSYEEAIRLDSTFAPAQRKLAQTYRYLGGGSVRRHFELAVRHKHRLGARDSLLILLDSLELEANTHPFGPARRRSVAVLEEMTRRYEDDAESWVLYGNLVSWSGFRLWKPPIPYTGDFRRSLYERGVSADSLNVDALLSSAMESMGLGDSLWAVRRLSQCVRSAPSGMGVDACAALLALLNRPHDAATMALLDSAPEFVEIQTQYLADFPDAAERALIAARRLATHGRRQRSELTRLGLEFALASRGHLADAWTLTTESSGSQLAGQVAALGGASLDEASRYFRRVPDSSLASWWRNSAWWIAARQDTVALLTLLKEGRIAVGRAKTSDERRGPLHARDVAAALLLLARADSAAALEALLSVPDSLCGGCLLLRFSTARLLASRGRLREAETWLSQTPSPTAVGPMAVMWRLERARVAERLGNRAQAIDDYSHVAAIWQHADSVLQPYVVESRRALARLRADR